MVGNVSFTHRVAFANSDITDFILAFFDVQGNYFVVLAYRYTTILSAQLISFWAIVLVVVVSFIFLKVRYHWSQILGILICIGGMGVLMYSDYRGGSRISGGVTSEVKGNLFMVVSATSYGIANVLEEFLVSKRPLYEVMGQIGFWGIMINGVQAAIFDRTQFVTADWSPKNGGYFTGFTLFLFSFCKSPGPASVRASSDFKQTRSRRYSFAWRPPRSSTSVC